MHESFKTIFDKTNKYIYLLKYYNMHVKLKFDESYGQSKIVHILVRNAIS